MGSNSVSKAKLALSRINRLPPLSPITEESYVPSSRSSYRSLSPRQVTPRSGQPIENLDDLIARYLDEPTSGTPKPQPRPHIPSYACPCCQEVNRQNTEKQRGKISDNFVEPVPESTNLENDGELEAESDFIDAPGLFRSDTFDLREQSGINTVDFNSSYSPVYRVPPDPVTTKRISKRTPQQRSPYKPYTEPIGTDNSLLQSILEANAKYNQAMQNLGTTIDKI